MPTRRSHGRVTVRLTTRAAAAGGEGSVKSSTDGAASSKGVGLPSAANGTASAAGVETTAGKSGMIYSFSDAAAADAKKVNEVKTSNYDGDGNDGNNNNGGGGDGNNGGAGGGGGNNNFPATMKALASWASTRAKGSRAVDGGLWLAAGSLLGANLTAWVLLGFMRGGERAGHGGTGILKKAEAARESEAAAVAAVAAEAPVAAKTEAEEKQQQMKKEEEATLEAAAALVVATAAGVAAAQASEVDVETTSDLTLEAVAAVMEAAEANSNPLNAPALASVHAIAQTAAADGADASESPAAADAEVAAADADAAAADTAVTAVAAAAAEFDAAVNATTDMLSFAVIPMDAKDPRIVAALRDAAEAQIAAAEAMRAAAAATRSAADATAAVQLLQASIASGAQEDAVTSGMEAATVSMASRAAAAHSKVAKRAAESAAMHKGYDAFDYEAAEAADAAADDDDESAADDESEGALAKKKKKKKSVGSAEAVDADWLHTAARAAGRTAVAAASAGAVAAGEAYRVASPIVVAKAKDGFSFVNTKYGPTVKEEVNKVKAQAEAEFDKVWNGKEEETVEPNGRKIRSWTPGLKQRSAAAMDKLRADVQAFKASVSPENIKKSLTAVNSAAKP